MFGKKRKKEKIIFFFGMNVCYFSHILFVALFFHLLANFTKQLQIIMSYK